MIAGDVLIRGGTVVDGTGGAARALDVRVAGGVIVELGSGLSADGAEVFDATGAVVAPGFIDSHTHFDVSLFWDPACDPMPAHGVTTVVIGNCSLSLAPIRTQDRRAASETFSFIEDIPLDAFEQSVPWTWESYPEYVAAMRARRFGVNVVGLVGHSMLRLAVIGPESWDRAADAAERAEMVSQLDAALAAGARGLSVSFFDRGADGRPVPSTRADDEELAALVEVVGRRGGHLELIPMSVAQQRDDAIALLSRVGRWCGDHGASMSWNAFIDVAGDPSLSQAFLELARRLQADGVRAFPQMSPRPIELAVDFEQTMGFMFLPAWNELVRAQETTKRSMIHDPRWRERAARDWDEQSQEFFPHRNPDRVHITSVANDSHARLVGRTLADWVAEHGGHPSDALADLVATNDFRPGLNYTVANSDVQRVGELCADPSTIVSASDAGAHLRMFCASGDTTLLLTRHVRERADLTLEAAVAELTGRQADVFGLHDRGRIAMGLRADLVVFDLGELHWDEAQTVYDVPPSGTPRFRRPSGGYRATFVGGVPTQTDGQPTGQLPGQWLPEPPGI